MDFVCNGHLAIDLAKTLKGSPGDNAPAACGFHCRDRLAIPMCVMQASKGGCDDVAYAKTMRYYCASTCGVCKALGVPSVSRESLPLPKCIVSEVEQEGCRDWASRGECIKNFEFMSIYCPVECGLCSVDGKIPVPMSDALKMKKAKKRRKRHAAPKASAGSGRQAQNVPASGAATGDSQAPKKGRMTTDGHRVFYKSRIGESSWEKSSSGSAEGKPAVQSIVEWCIALIYEAIETQWKLIIVTCFMGLLSLLWLFWAAETDSPGWRSLNASLDRMLGYLMDAEPRSAGPPPRPIIRDEKLASLLLLVTSDDDVWALVLSWMPLKEACVAAGTCHAHMRCLGQSRASMKYLALTLARSDTLDQLPRLLIKEKTNCDQQYRNKELFELARCSVKVAHEGESLMRRGYPVLRVIDKHLPRLRVLAISLDHPRMTTLTEVIKWFHIFEPANLYNPTAPSYGIPWQGCMPYGLLTCPQLTEVELSTHSILNAVEIGRVGKVKNQGHPVGLPAWYLESLFLTLVVSNWRQLSRLSILGIAPAVIETLLLVDLPNLAVLQCGDSEQHAALTAGDIPWPTELLPRIAAAFPTLEVRVGWNRAGGLRKR
jgi:hypothetical protein